MDVAACSGLLNGRPFGGVAILWDTSVIKKVSVVGSDPSRVFSDPSWHPTPELFSLTTKLCRCNY